MNVYKKSFYNCITDYNFGMKRSFENIPAAKNLAIVTRDGFSSYYGGYMPDVKKSLYWLKKVLEMREKKDV